MLNYIIWITLFINLRSCAVVEWGQCDGQDYTGDKQCATGLVCVYINQYFSQCQKSVTSPPSQISSTGTFTVNNKKIFDANGKEFMIRGVNNAHADWDNYGRSWALKSLKKLPSTKLIR